MKKKNLLILGATGGIGRWTLKTARERGFNITIVVRSKESLKDTAGIRIIEGNLLNEGILEEAVLGQDFVISCLGIKRKNGSNPWSSIVSPLDFTERVMSKTLHLMGNDSSKRLVAVSSAGVGESWKLTTPFMKFFVSSSNIKTSFKDLQNMEEVLQNSVVETLAVRPVMLTDGPVTGETKFVNKFGMSTKISRADVAMWMLDALERKTPFKAEVEMIG